MKKLPKTIYVAIKGEPGDQWISASATAAAEVEDDGPTVIGTYQLVELKSYSKELTAKPVKG